MDLLRNLTEEQPFLQCGVPSSDYRDLAALEEKTVAGGAERDPPPDKLRLPGHAQAFRPGAGRDYDGLRRDGLLGSNDFLMGAPVHHLRHFGELYLKPQGPRLLLEELHQVDAVYALEARVVLYDVGHAYLAADAHFFKQDRFQVRPLRINTGRKPARPPAYYH